YASRAPAGAGAARSRAPDRELPAVDLEHVRARGQRAHLAARVRRLHEAAVRTQVVRSNSIYPPPAPLNAMWQKAMACVQCHAMAQTAVGTPADFSFLLYLAQQAAL